MPTSWQHIILKEHQKKKTFSWSLWNKIGALWQETLKGGFGINIGMVLQKITQSVVKNSGRSVLMWKPWLEYKALCML